MLVSSLFSNNFALNLVKILDVQFAAGDDGQVLDQLLALGS